MKQPLTFPKIAFTAFATMVCVNLQADPVTDWHTFNATATVLSGQGTSSPIFGSTASTAQNGFLIGYLANPLSLASTGDKITFTFDVSFNDAVGMANGGDNFRFALFDVNGQPHVTADNTGTAGVDGQTDNFRGYIFGIKNGAGTGSGGSMRERIAQLVTGDNSFAATGGNAVTAPSIGTVGGTSVTFAGAINGSGSAPLYSGQMVLTKTASGIDVSGFFVGNNSANSNTFAASDITAPTSTTFGAVGFLNGAGISADQLLFQNIDVVFTPVPEPSTMILSGVGLLALAFRAIRSRRV